MINKPLKKSYLSSSKNIFYGLGIGLISGSFLGFSLATLLITNSVKEVRVYSKNEERDSFAEVRYRFGINNREMLEEDFENTSDSGLRKYVRLSECNGKKEIKR